MRIGFPKKVPAPIDQSCILYWKFDESSGTMRDYSSGNNTGIATGSPTYSTTGKFGTALSFDGIDDHIESTNTYSVDTATYGYTIEAWIYSVSDKGYSWNSIAGINISDATFGLASLYGTIIGAWACGNFGTGPNVGNINNAWHHIAGVYTQSSIFIPVKMYFDGKYVGNSVTDRGSTCSFTGKFQIAKSYVGYNTWFNGVVDDVRMYNRSLSASEIYQHYLRGR